LGVELTIDLLVMRGDGDWVTDWPCWAARPVEVGEASRSRHNLVLGLEARRGCWGIADAESADEARGPTPFRTARSADHDAGGERTGTPGAGGGGAGGAAVCGRHTPEPRHPYSPWAHGAAATLILAHLLALSNERRFTYTYTYTCSLAEPKGSRCALCER
jgi:hypothetical protein